MLRDRHQRQFRDDGDSCLSDAKRSDDHHVHVIAGTPERKLRREASAKPAVELVIECESLVGNMFHHGFEAIACRHDLLYFTDQQHQALWLAGC